MAEYNVLAGDINVLAQIKSDIKEHNIKIDRLEHLSNDRKELKRNIDVLEKNVNDSIEDALKKGIDAVCSGFNNAIDLDNEKIRKIQGEKDKAKLQGVKERIASETASLKEENEEYYLEIKAAFKMNKIPKMCSTKFFISFFITKGIKDILLYILILMILFLAIPGVAYLIVKDIPIYQIIIFYFIEITVVFSIYKFLANRYVLPHAETLYEARDRKIKIAKNKRRMKKIEKNIKKDTNEEIYGLEDYDYRINEIHDDIKKIEAKRDIELQLFENQAKPDIVEEIVGRDKDKINAMKQDYEKKSEEYSKLEELIKEQRIYISSNYEAYLGKDNSSVERLEELYSIMNAGKAATIGQALAVYQERK